jgi:cytoskeletal protein CcmA (bactofilin family)
MIYNSTVGRIPGSHVATEDGEADSVGGGLRVEDGVRFEVEGNVGGNVDVGEDADLYVGGNVGGNVSAAEGSLVTIDGNVGGNVRTEGDITLNGRVGGNVEVVGDGEADVDEAQVDPSSELSTSRKAASAL